MSEPYEPYPTASQQPGQPVQYDPTSAYYAANAPRPKDLTLTALLSVGAAVAVTASSVVDAVLVGRAIDDPGVSTPAALVYAGNALLSFLLLVGAYVATCLWLWRARENAQLISPDLHHARKPGWIWGGWVCPVVNFWFPSRSSGTSTGRRPGAWAPRPPSVPGGPSGWC